MTGGREDMLSSEVSPQWYQIAVPSTIPSTTALITLLVPMETSRLGLLLIPGLKFSSIQMSLRLVQASLRFQSDSGLFHKHARTEQL